MAFSDKAKSAIAQDALLNSLADEIRAALLSKSVSTRIRAGESVYRIGDPPGGIYFICDGGMRVEIATGAQNTFIGHFLAQGIWFGEPSALSGQPRVVGVIAAKDSELLYLSLPHLNQLIAVEPELIRHLARITQFHLRTAIGAIADLMIRDTEARFVAILLRLAGIRDNENPSGRWEVYFSQEEIATMANVARTTANTLLRKFERAKLIEITYRRIMITDGVGLRRLMTEER